MLNDNSKNLSCDFTNNQWIAFYTFGVQTWTQSDCKWWHTLFLDKNVTDSKTHFFGQRLEPDYKPTALKENIKSQYNGNTIQYTKYRPLILFWNFS